MTTTTEANAYDDGVLSIPVSYQLGDGVRAAVERNGGTVEHLVLTSFFKLVNEGNGLNILYQYIAIPYGELELGFAVASRRTPPDGPVEIGISLAPRRMFVYDEDMPEFLSARMERDPHDEH